MPYDWLFAVEKIVISLIPAYTLEMLDQCDIERLLPYYFYDHRKTLWLKKQTETSQNGPTDCDVTELNGKKYRRVSADKITPHNNVF